MITGYSDGDLIKEAILDEAREVMNKPIDEQSGRPFLPKPFTPRELQTIVSNTLRCMEMTE